MKYSAAMYYPTPDLGLLDFVFHALWLSSRVTSKKIREIPKKFTEKSKNFTQKFKKKSQRNKKNIIEKSMWLAIPRQENMAGAPPPPAGPTSSCKMFNPGEIPSNFFLSKSLRLIFILEI